MTDNAGRNRLKDLAKGVREKVQNDGRQQLDRRGIDLLEQIVSDLTGPDGMPGLYVHRDTALKVRFRRQGKAGQIVVEWDRTIGAMAVTYERFNARTRQVRYLYSEEDDAWRAMENHAEIYDELTTALMEILYPEGQPR